MSCTVTVCVYCMVLLCCRKYAPKCGACGGTIMPSDVSYACRGMGCLSTVSVVFYLRGSTHARVFAIIVTCFTPQRNSAYM